MKPVTELVKIMHGSHLYGTSTPFSDLDYKAVHLPAGDSIVLGRPEDHITRSFVAKENGKNTSDAIDDTSFSLQKWAKMLASGDTIGTEILFAPDSAIVYQNDDWPVIRAMGRALINRKVAGFVGYCQRQAAKYGIKGSRMATCEAAVTLLDELARKHGNGDKLVNHLALLQEFCDQHEYSEIVNLPSQHGVDVWYIDVLSRKVPITATIQNALNLYRKIYDNYGQRAISAKNNEGIDWKAMSHAVRVAGQALELLKNGEITFPRPEAPFLLSIKKGEVPYAYVAELLEKLVEELVEAEASSHLPETTDQASVDGMILYFYNRQIVGKPA